MFAGAPITRLIALALADRGQAVLDRDPFAQSGAPRHRGGQHLETLPEVCLQVNAQGSPPGFARRALTPERAGLAGGGGETGDLAGSDRHDLAGRPGGLPGRQIKLKGPLAELPGPVGGRPRPTNDGRPGSFAGGDPVVPLT